MRCALIHGFGGSPAAWDDVIDAWQLPEPPLAIALPGHGGGPVLPTWDENLAVVARAVDHFDAVVGYSLGARVALGLVAGGLVAHGVLIGVNPGIQDAERDQRREFDAAWARMLRTEGVAVFHDAWTKQPLFATQQRVAPDKLAERRARRVALDAEQLARSLEVMGLAGMPDYWPAVSAHRDRIALLAGADDAKYVALSASLPCAYFEQIPNSGHDPTLENPRDLAAAIARAVAKLR
ncbi:MAG TPA: alpha/beta fold hydrolase [Kofleriaceae bacterium]|jgi:2-succinyl-6-hydroxy-2,4-cyclohexadiene-1-carboxylate synthase|nr:alpha/beta fold hydrolase [Kofleriaceae bacterium]